MAEHRRSGKLAVILHADVAGSTDLVRRDEQLAHDRIQTTFRRFGDVITKYHGSVRELRGDALLAEFERASDAVTAALAFQDAQFKYLSSLNDAIQPVVRVGIAMGEVIVADDTITGEGVVLAQRLEQLSEPSTVVIQGSAYEAIPGRFPFEYDNLGEHEVKGFEEPVRVYRARLKGGTDLPQPTPTVHRARNTLIVLASVAVVAAGVALMWFKPWEIREEPASVERMAFPLPNKPSIAVLPFDNLSGDEEQEYFSDGITNDIITDLTKFKGLFVISSNSTFTYKGKPVKVQQVAEELGVRYVLEGSVQTTADRIRINAQLIDATSGRHLWAERYDRAAGDMFAIQNEIIETIVSTLAFKVETAERERVLRKGTESLDAYDNYLRAVNFDRFTKEANAKAGELYEKAIDLDPRYATAISRLAWVHAIAYSFGWSENPEISMRRALELAKKAVALAPDDHWSHWTLGYIYLLRREFDLSEAAYERAHTLNPNDAEFLSNRATTLLYLGRPEEAIEGIKKAMRLNPHHPESLFAELGWAYYEAGQYEQSVKTFRSMNGPPTWVHRTLAAAYVRLGKLEEARSEISQMLKKEPEYSLENTKVWPYKNPEKLDSYIQDLRRAGVPEHPPLKLPDKPSIAVLPFTNISNDAEQEYFVDGMTEDLITDLSQLSGLFVIARNSVFTYKGKPVKVRRVAEELGVRYVLEGSVRRVGNQVRINAQLIDASSGGHLWAERYDGSLDNVFALQDQVTQQIVKALRVNLTRKEKEGKTQHGTEISEAYDAFLQGWAYYKLLTPENLAQSILFLEEAIRIDPEYAQAHAALAAVYWDAYVNDWAFDLNMPSTRAEGRANEHLEEALKDPTPLAYAVNARMMASYGFYDQAVSEAERAVALDPNDATTYAGLAEALIRAGKPKEAIDGIQKAMRLDPHHPPDYLITLGAAQFGTEDYEEAAVTFERAVKRNPGSELPRIYLAASYGHLGRIEDGEAVIEATNDLRNTRGLGSLSLEKSVNDGFSPFRGEIDFKALGIKAVQDQVRAGLARIPILTWQYLVTTHYVSGAGNSWWEVEGATPLDVVSAKTLHDKGVLFVDTSDKSVWVNSHIPGAVNLPYNYDKTNPSSLRYKKITLSKLVNQEEEFVLYWRKPGFGGCSASFEAAKAVRWGFKRVYWLQCGTDWDDAGYPLEQGE